MNFEMGDWISLVAVAIAFVSLYRTRKQSEIENKLKEESLKLTQLQLKILEMEEELNNSAEVSAYFYLDAKSQYRVAICNKGNSPAKQVTFNMTVAGEDRSPLIKEDLDSKFPALNLMPGEEIYLIAAITIDMSPAFDAVITWDNPDGNSKRREMRLSLPG